MSWPDEIYEDVGDGKIEYIIESAETAFGTQLMSWLFHGASNDILPISRLEC